MARPRRNYTYDEAKAVLAKWVKDQGLTPGSFWRWLESRGVTITRQTCHNLYHGNKEPGEQFKAVFKEITNIQLVDGLIEQRRSGK